MSQKYPKQPKKEPMKKVCLEQRMLEDKTFDLKVFNFLKDNLEIEIDELNKDKKIFKIMLKNPVSGEVEEICKEYE